MTNTKNKKSSNKTLNICKTKNNVNVNPVGKALISTGFPTDKVNKQILIDNENSIIQDTYSTKNDIRVIIELTAPLLGSIDNQDNNLSTARQTLQHMYDTDEDMQETIVTTSRPINFIAITSSDTVPGKQILNKETWIKKFTTQ